MPLANDQANDAGRSPARPDVLVNTGLGAVFALGIALTAYLLVISWGGAYWACTTAVSAVTCGLALLRGRRRPWPALAGLATAAGAVGASLAADLPQEPSPMTALALAVLVGSSLRRLPAPSAVAVAVGGVAVTAFGWAAGRPGPMALATMLMAGGYVAGALLRAADLARRSGPAGPPPAGGARW